MECFEVPVTESNRALVQIVKVGCGSAKQIPSGAVRRPALSGPIPVQVVVAGNVVGGYSRKYVHSRVYLYFVG